MNGYISKWDRAKAYVDKEYPASLYSDTQRRNVLRQIFAKKIVGNGSTIGKRIGGKFTITKPNGRVLIQL